MYVSSPDAQSESLSGSNRRESILTIGPISIVQPRDFKGAWTHEGLGLKTMYSPIRPGNLDGPVLKGKAVDYFDGEE
jgi:hypothetical protein